MTKRQWSASEVEVRALDGGRGLLSVATESLGPYAYGLCKRSTFNIHVLP